MARRRRRRAPPPSAGGDPTLDRNARDAAEAPPGRSAARAALIALVSSLAIVAAVWSVPQGLYSDPSWQLRAAQQFHAGRSPSINTLVQPAAADLTQDRGEWVLWWSPGTQLATYPLMRSEMPVGDAVRVVAAACLVLGAVGWALWFARFQLPRLLLYGLAVAFPWMRYASNALFLYSAEALLFAVVPWLLLASLGLARAAREGRRAPPLLGRALLVGLALGASYVLKYSALLAVGGMVAFVAAALVFPGAVERVRGAPAHAAGTRDRAWRVGAALLCLAGVAAPVMALTFLNQSRANAANLVTASAGLNASWEHVARGLLNPVVAATDAEAVLKFVLMNPARPAVVNDRLFMLAALPGALVLYWVLGGAVRAWRRPGNDGEPNWTDARLLSLACFAGSVGALLLIWFVSRGASYEARHLAAGSFALLPLALAAGVGRWRAGGRGARVVLAGAGALYVALPLAYGAVATLGKAGKAGRSAKGYRVGAARLSSPRLTGRDVAACVASASAGFDTTRDVWYLPEPIAALDLPGRAILVDADFSYLEQLRERRYRSSRPLHVRVLLPPHVENDEKGRVILASFVGAGSWARTELPRCRYAAWDATLAGGGPTAADLVTRSASATTPERAPAP